MSLSNEEFARLANEGGASRNFKTGKPPIGPGVMVSIPGAEKVTKGPTSAKEVGEYFSKNVSKSKSDYYQGAWPNKGKIYHDVSVKEPTLESARKFGVLGKQIAGYDLGGTDKSRPEGGNIYFNRNLPGIQAEKEWKSGKTFTSSGERLSNKPTSKDRVELAHVNRSSKRINKAGKQVPVTINEVLDTIAKNRRMRAE